MHSLLIAIAFLVIVLSPCVAALWNRSEPAFPKARPFTPGLIIPGDPVAPANYAHRSEMLRCSRASRSRAIYKHEVSALAQAAIPSAGIRN